MLPQHITCTFADANHVEHPQVCAPLVRQAIDFIQANCARDISMADIAAAINVTPRAVQYMFRRHLDTTPMAYLRRIRLDRAHRDLLAADPSHDTVSGAPNSLWVRLFGPRLPARLSRRCGRPERSSRRRLPPRTPR